MAEPGFKHMTMWLDIRSGFELQTVSIQVCITLDGSNQPYLNVRHVGANTQVECKRSHKPQQSTASVILKYQPPTSTGLLRLQITPQQK